MSHTHVSATLHSKPTKKQAGIAADFEVYYYMKSMIIIKALLQSSHTELTSTLSAAMCQQHERNRVLPPGVKSFGQDKFDLIKAFSIIQQNPAQQSGIFREPKSIYMCHDIAATVHILIDA